MAENTKATIHLTRTRVLVGALALVLLCSGASFAAAQAGGEGRNIDPSDPFTDTDDPGVIRAGQAGCMGDAGGAFHPTWKVLRRGLAPLLLSCAGRADFAERTAQVSSTSQLLLDRTLYPGGGNEIGDGGFFVLDYALEVSTSQPVTTPCSVRFSFADNGTSGVAAEQVWVDIPAAPDRTTQHLNASMVERVELGPAYRTGAFVQAQLFGVVEGSCGVPVTTDVAMTSVYTPLDGQGQTIWTN
jgi:hypothetical protein